MDGQTSTSSSHQSLRRPRAGLPTEGGDASAAESAELHLPLRRGAPLGDHLRRVAVLRAEIALLRAEDHRLAQQREVLRQREQLQQRSSALDAAVQKARERLEVGAEPSPARRRGSVLAWMHAHQDSYSDCGISSDGDSGSRGGSLVSSGNSDRGGSGSGGGSRSGPEPATVSTRFVQSSDSRPPPIFVQSVDSPSIPPDAELPSAQQSPAAHLPSPRCLPTPQSTSPSARLSNLDRRTRALSETHPSSSKTKLKEGLREGQSETHPSWLVAELKEGRRRLQAVRTDRPAAPPPPAGLAPAARPLRGLAPAVAVAAPAAAAAAAAAAAMAAVAAVGAVAAEASPPLTQSLDYPILIQSLDSPSLVQDLDSPSLTACAASTAKAVVAAGALEAPPEEATASALEVPASASSIVKYRQVSASASEAPASASEAPAALTEEAAARRLQGAWRRMLDRTISDERHNLAEAAEPVAEAVYGELRSSFAFAQAAVQSWAVVEAAADESDESTQGGAQGAVTADAGKAIAADGAAAKAATDAIDTALGLRASLEQQLTQPPTPTPPAPPPPPPTPTPTSQVPLRPPPLPPMVEAHLETLFTRLEAERKAAAVQVAQRRVLELELQRTRDAAHIGAQVAAVVRAAAEALEDVAIARARLAVATAAFASDYAGGTLAPCIALAHLTKLSVTAAAAATHRAGRCLTLARERVVALTIAAAEKVAAAVAAAAARCVWIPRASCTALTALATAANSASVATLDHAIALIKGGCGGAMLACEAFGQCMGMGGVCKARAVLSAADWSVACAKGGCSLIRGGCEGMGGALVALATGIGGCARATGDGFASLPATAARAAVATAEHALALMRACSSDGLAGLALGIANATLALATHAAELARVGGEGCAAMAISVASAASALTQSIVSALQAGAAGVVACVGSLLEAAGRAAMAVAHVAVQLGTSPCNGLACGSVLGSLGASAAACAAGLATQMSLLITACGHTLDSLVGVITHVVSGSAGALVHAAVKAAAATSAYAVALATATAAGVAGIASVAALAAAASMAAAEYASAAIAHGGAALVKRCGATVTHLFEAVQSGCTRLAEMVRVVAQATIKGATMAVGGIAMAALAVGAGAVFLVMAGGKGIASIAVAGGTWLTQLAVQLGQSLAQGSMALSELAAKLACATGDGLQLAGDGVCTLARACANAAVFIGRHTLIGLKYMAMGVLAVPAAIVFGIAQAAIFLGKQALAACAATGRGLAALAKIAARGAIASGEAAMQACQATGHILAALAREAASAAAAVGRHVLLLVEMGGKGLVAVASSLATAARIMGEYALLAVQMLGKGAWLAVKYTGLAMGAVIGSIALGLYTGVELLVTSVWKLLQLGGHGALYAAQAIAHAAVTVAQFTAQFTWSLVKAAGTGIVVVVGGVAFGLLELVKGIVAAAVTLGRCMKGYLVTPCVRGLKNCLSALEDGVEEAEEGSPRAVRRAARLAARRRLEDEDGI